jgi:hypothetical protein
MFSPSVENNFLDQDFSFFVRNHEILLHSFLSQLKTGHYYVKVVLKRRNLLMGGYSYDLLLTS